MIDSIGIMYIMEHAHMYCTVACGLLSIRRITYKDNMVHVSI